MRKYLNLFVVIAGICLSVSTVRAQEYPDFKWSYLTNPSEQGWSQKKLDQLHQYLIDSTAITGYMIIHKGKIVFAYGDVSETSYIASCRKSVLSLLYGAYVKSGVINLDQSIGELGIDDLGGLLPSEKEATVRDLIAARSGVYHPASLLGDHLAYAPKRGSVKHSTYWLYNNWDFNLAGYIFETLTRRSIYDEVDRVLAKPLHMEDWERSDQEKNGDLSRSKYPAYPMYFSTRDMARLGQLMLNKGNWAGKQVIDQSWIAEILTPRTNYFEIDEHIPDYRTSGYSMGYGYMWWLWQNIKDKRFEGAYSALGNMGQSISVFPAANVVIVYKTKARYERETSFLARHKVLSKGVEALEK